MRSRRKAAGVVVAMGVLMAFAIHADAELLAGVAQVSVTPSEAGLPTPLGGYGEREGKPAEGVHDTLRAKMIVFQWQGTKSAIVTVDACSVPLSLLRESVSKAAIAGLAMEGTIMSASHDHAGLDGFVMASQNTIGNPRIGVFSPEVLGFVSDRIAEGLKQADAALRPVTVGSGVVTVNGATQNRRGDAFVDDDLTVLRLDDASGRPYAVLVNFTAHGTIMTEKEMLASGGWAGNMQRTVESLMGGGVTCLYTNGAEGDVRPCGAQGGSRWEMAEDYGRKIGIQAARLAEVVKPKPVSVFAMETRQVSLPERKPAPDFVATAGLEYGIDEAQVGGLVTTLFPETAPFSALRVDDFQMVTIPGEPICQIGLALKQVMRSEGLKYPCVAGVTSDYIGYILTQDEYAQSGYEVAASFYGDGLGALVLDQAGQLAASVAKR